MHQLRTVLAGGDKQRTPRPGGDKQRKPRAGGDKQRKPREGGGKQRTGSVAPLAAASAARRGTRGTPFPIARGDNQRIAPAVRRSGYGDGGGHAVANVPGERRYRGGIGLGLAHP